MILTLVILVFVILGICGIFVFLADSAFGRLDFSSSGAAVDQVIGIIRQRHLENGKLYDLGSARGGFALKIAKAFPDMQVKGIDNDGFRVLLANIRSKFQKNIQFRKQDILSTDVSSADIVYLYLPQELMPELQLKFQNELKVGCLIITNKVSFPKWQPQEKLKELFIYAKI